MSKPYNIRLKLIGADRSLSIDITEFSNDLWFTSLWNVLDVDSDYQSTAITRIIDDTFAHHQTVDYE